MRATRSWATPSASSGSDGFRRPGKLLLPLGRYGDSARWFKAAAQAEPERLEYRVKRDLSAKLAARLSRHSA
jgi:hypothetical protein